MASSGAIVGTFSRFAALKVEELSDENETTQTNKDKSQKKSNAEKNAKKKARKKKKAAVEHEVTNELRNLAFSKPVSAQAVQNVHQQRHIQETKSVSTPSSSTVEQEIASTGESVDIVPTWEEWRNKDEEFVVDQFQKDLETALRLSASDLERSQRNLQENSKSKKKASKKQPTMSLDEFTSLNVLKPTDPLETPTTPVQLDPHTLLNGYCPEEIDPHHYTRGVPEDKKPVITTSQQNGHTSQNKKTKRKKKKVLENKPLSEVLTELHQEEKTEIQPTSGTDQTTFLALQNALDEKDIQLQELRKELENTKTELSQVKKRNKQFCIILAQGEMKEKSEILQQVDELTNIKNELSEQLLEMHSSLEQERSKNSTLRSDLLKYQNGRAKTKSISDEK